MDDSKTVSKGTLGCLRFALVILFAVAANVVAACVSIAFGVRIEPGFVGGLSVLYLVLANVAADRILKRFGLSRSGVVVEVRARSAPRPGDDAPIGDVAEAHISRGMMTFLLLGMPIMGLFLAASPLILKEDRGVMRWVGMGLGVFFLVGFAFVLWDRKKPQARADAEGITGYRSPNAIRRAFVPWSDVRTCEIRTIHDTLGQPVLLVPILRGHDGEILMRLKLLYTPMAEQEKVVKFIKSKLPKTQVDPWEP